MTFNTISNQPIHLKHVVGVCVAAVYSAGIPIVIHWLVFSRWRWERLDRCVTRNWQYIYCKTSWDSMDMFQERTRMIMTTYHGVWSGEWEVCMSQRWTKENVE